jgi:hypothetical protein
MGDEAIGLRSLQVWKNTETTLQGPAAQAAAKSHRRGADRSGARDERLRRERLPNSC